MIGYVYKYTSPSKKSYIGQTRVNIKKRAGKDGIGYTKTNTYFSSAIKKYGFDNFSLEILHIVNEKDIDSLLKTLCNLEKEEIQKHNTLYPNGYNLTTGGLKSSYSQEVRDKMSKKAKERFLDEDYRRKHSESQKLRFQSPDERYKCGNGNRGNASKRKGCKLSEEQRRKISTATSIGMKNWWKKRKQEKYV